MFTAALLTTLLDVDRRGDFAMRLRALVIDDDISVRRLAVRALTSRGFECRSVANTALASNLLAQERFDLVLFHLLMPGEHGYRLLVKVLGEKERSTVGVLTGVTVPRVEAHLRQLGIDDFAYKPVNYSRFADVLLDKTQRRNGSQSARGQFQT